MTSQRLSITIEALGRSYDHVVIDAGTATAEAPHQGVHGRLFDGLCERFANLAPRVVLVAPALDNPQTALVRERLLAAGFANVSVVVNAPHGPDVEVAGAQAAA
jgi:hypothetical protein